VAEAEAKQSGYELGLTKDQTQKMSTRGEEMGFLKPEHFLGGLVRAALTMSKDHLKGCPRSCAMRRR
jgi:hypothetical protein